MDKVKSFLLSKHIKVPEDWLDQCIEYLEEEFKELTMPQLLDLVFQQWLTADLKELELPVFPNCIAKANRFVLNGNFSVQMNSIFDASISAYSQLQKINNTENANANVTGEDDEKKPWEPKAKRMLVLELTDGVQNVRAMEYQSIPVLNSALPPGTKILLKGRIECRKGMLMLTNENVEVLGGSVDHLIETAGQKKLLNDRLNLPNIAKETKGASKRSSIEHPTVKSIDSAMQRNLTSNNNDTIKQPVQRFSENSIKREYKNDLDEMKMEEYIPPFLDMPDDFSDLKREDIFDDDDDDVILLQNNPSSSNFKAEIEDMDDDDVVLLQAVDVVEHQKPKTGNGTSNLGTSAAFERNSKMQKRFDNFPSTSSATCLPPPSKKERLNDDFNDVENVPEPTIFDDSGNVLLPDAYASQSSTLANVIGHVSSNSGDYEVNITYEPTNGIDLKLHMNSNLKSKTSSDLKLVKLCTLLPFTLTPGNTHLCTVKAAVLHTISHLKLNNGEKWSYVAKVTDGTATLDCELSDDLLSELIEMTASEALAVKNSLCESTKTQAIERVKKAANFVQTFNGLMQIETRFKFPSIIRKMKPLNNSDMKTVEKIFCFGYCK